MLKVELEPYLALRFVPLMFYTGASPMPSPANQPDVDAGASIEAEQLAHAYLQAAKGNRWAALVRLAQNAVSDLDRAEGRIREREALISRGYVRAHIEH